MPFHFEVINEGKGIKISDQKLNVELHYGVNASKFMNYFKNLSDNYNFKINRLYFKESIVLDGEKRPVNLRAIHEYTIFIIYSNVLESLGVDIKNLVTQIKPCRDYRMIRHARGLAELGFVYYQNEYEIEFLPKKGPDLILNGVKCDLKVAQPYLLSQHRGNLKVSKGRVMVPYEIMYEITQSIKSRFEEVGDSDALFFDLSGGALFSSLSLSVYKFYRIVEPLKNRIICYSVQRFPPGLEIHKGPFSNSRVSFKPEFPELFSLIGYYIDFDPILWSSIKEASPT